MHRLIRHSGYDRGKAFPLRGRWLSAAKSDEVDAGQETSGKGKDNIYHPRVPPPKALPPEDLAAARLTERAGIPPSPSGYNPYRRDVINLKEVSP
jgi:hypothetical protein